MTLLHIGINLLLKEMIVSIKLSLHNYLITFLTNNNTIANKKAAFEFLMLF